MIIKNKIDNEPVLSNVGEVGEFRIRNSAKAFNILSSGLYANKIRAIIREYSCNAVDSHVEAGRGDVPFDVHLPTVLEPWFAVRDYGVGLDEQQVRNIFTTYFESTKTATDELIGGLGLGSKSAFSFTDNFTIVAIKGGVKRVYTAFINDQGVPSIAPMGEEPTSEPNGVEIRFAVEDSWDFHKFHDEARHVYKHFKLRPVVSGVSDFQFIDPEYVDRDIIPGVHASARSFSSFAIMGNIEYPLNVPSNADLGDVGHLLKCGLTIEFAIGELDIQASREGLSYIPETIAAIKAKLEAVNAVLTEKLTTEVDAIKNKWEKAFFLEKKINTDLWNAAARQYIANTKFDLCDAGRYSNTKAFNLNENDLAKKYNIKVSAFRITNSYGTPTAKNVSTENVYNNTTKLYEKVLVVRVADCTQFVVNDTNVGVIERSKYHWKNSGKVSRDERVYVLDRADRTKDMKLAAFFKSLSNPPKNQIRKASTLMQKERASGLGKDLSILKLEKRDNRGHMRSDDMVWRDAGKLDQFDDSKTYYYLPMSGFMCQGAVAEGGYDMKTFARALMDSGVFTETVYGVRKADLEAIKSKTNWVNLDDHVRNKMTQKNALNVRGIIKQAIDFNNFFKYSYLTDYITDSDSPFLKLYNEFVCVTAVDASVRRGFEALCIIYKVTSGTVDVTDEINKYKAEMENLKNRYPLLCQLDRYYRDTKAIAEYINAIDLMKK